MFIVGEDRGSTSAIRVPGVLIILSFVFIASISPINAEKEAPEPATALSTARKLLDAFNRHDPDAMALLVSGDFELYYFDKKGVPGLAVSGPEQLVAEMTSYFADRPSVRSRIVGEVDGPSFVSFREQIVNSLGEEPGPSSLAVYEVRDSLIRRVWYYPAEEHQPDARTSPESNSAQPGDD